MQKTYQVKGMKCAGCSVAVENAIKDLKDVKKADVNLAMGKLRVESDLAINSNIIIEAVEKAGFEAEEMQEDEESSPGMGEDDYFSKLKLIVPMSIALMYVAMSHMMNLPMPLFLGYFDLMKHPIAFVLLQIVLTVPIMYFGREFYKNGFKSLINKNPNMDALIAISTSTAFLYSVYISGKIIGISISNVTDVLKHQMIMEQAHGLYFDTAGMIIAIVLIGRYLEDKSKWKAKESITALLKLKPQSANVKMGDDFIEKPIKEIKIGDVVQVKSGENVPIDGIIIKGSCSVDESMITGESVPVDRFEGEQLVGGSTNVNGLVEIKVNRVGADTFLSKIIKMVDEAQMNKPPIARLADKVVGVFVPIVIALALFTGIFWQIYRGDIGFSIKMFISVLVISCPCALGLATPTAVMVGIGRASQLGIFIRDGETLEAMDSIDCLVFDKTGTITKGVPIVSNFHNSSDLSDVEVFNYVYSVEQNSNHPVAKAICSFIESEDFKLKKYDVIEYKDEIGFGIDAVANYKHIVIGNTKLMKRNHLNYDEGIPSNAIHIGIDKKYCGYFIVDDEIKESSINVFDDFRDDKMKLKMLTGDSTSKALQIADRVGLHEDDVIAEILPEDKLNVVKKLKADGLFVGMVGDGINDTPALSEANVSFAMGEGSDIAVENADVIVMSNDLIDVKNAIDLSRATIRNIKENLFWAFIYNVIAIPFAAGFFHIFGGPLLDPMAGAIAMSMSSITVVLNALRLKSFKGKTHFTNTIQQIQTNPAQQTADEQDTQDESLI